MWWLLIGGLPLLLIDVLPKLFGSGAVREARETWAERHEELERAVALQEAEIRRRMRDSAASTKFRELVDLHWASVRQADAAYGLLQDARVSLDAMGQGLVDLKHRRDVLDREQQASRAHVRRGELAEELRLVRDLLKSVRSDLDVLRLQRDEMRYRVQSLNHQTSALAEVIGSKCGPRGREWAARRAERRAMRQLVAA